MKIPDKRTTSSRAEPYPTDRGNRSARNPGATSSARASRADSPSASPAPAQPGPASVRPDRPRLSPLVIPEHSIPPRAEPPSPRPPWMEASPAPAAMRPSSPTHAPDSPPLTPTGAQLKELTRAEDQMFAVPERPSHREPMSPGQHAVTDAFKANIDSADPHRTLRRQGEFFQTFRMEDGRAVPNLPIHFEAGGEIAKPPAGSFPPGTSHVIHSHPKDSFSNRPSSDDYYEAWKSKKTAGVPSEMMYDIGRDKVYGYEGTHPPTFHQLTPPQAQPTPVAAPERSRPPSSSSSSSSSSSGSDSE